MAQNYTIRNLELSRWPKWLELGFTKPHYLVVWHKNIALAHTWVDKPTNANEVLGKFTNSINATLENYGAQNTGLFWALNTEHDRANWLHQYFSSEDKIPKTVPISVVICTRHRAQDLKNCLTKLVNLPCQPAQIVVVDNGPDLPETAKVAAKFLHVTYVTEARPGLDIARNRGIIASNQPIIAYLDDDVQVHQNWVYEVWKTFNQHPEISAITGLVLAGSLKTKAQVVFEKHWSFNRGYIPIKYTPSFLTSLTGPPVWQIGAGANMAFRKKVFSIAGLFDERLDAGAAGCNGDSEMWFRILKSNYAILYQPKAIAWHNHRTTMAGLRKQIFQYMQGFTVACLIQEEQLPNLGYKEHIFNHLLPWFLKKSRIGFPFYRHGFSTFLQEVRGTLSGIWYYKNSVKNSPYKNPKL